jgi:hypothetical protein
VHAVAGAGAAELGGIEAMNQLYAYTTSREACDNLFAVIFDYAVSEVGDKKKTGQHGAPPRRRHFHTTHINANAAAFTRTVAHYRRASLARSALMCIAYVLAHTISPL